MDNTKFQDITTIIKSMGCDLMEINLIKAFFGHLVDNKKVTPLAYLLIINLVAKNRVNSKKKQCPLILQIPKSFT